MAFKGGNRRTGETTTLLGDQHILKGRNFIPDNDGVAVRSGMTEIRRLDDGVNTALPLAMKSVSISGEDIILLVLNNCEIEAIFPERTGMKYKVYRRYYDAEEQLLLGNDDYVPNYAEILQVGNFIYILSPTRSWVIYRDGLLRIKQDNIGKPSTVSARNDRIVVDAVDATIFDLDYESLKLTKTGKTGSYIRKGDYLHSRFRSEFGGRGAPSSPTMVQETNSYVVEVGGSLKRYYFTETDNTITKYDRYYPICYMHSAGAVQKESSQEVTDEAANEFTRYTKVLKNIFAYGIMALYSQNLAGDTATLTVACKGGENNHLKVGTKVGLTVPRNHYDGAHNTTWVDAVIVDNPASLPDAFNDYTCVTFEYAIPAFGDLAYGPYGLFDPTTYDADTDLVMHPFTLDGGTISQFVLWQTIDGKKYATAVDRAANAQGGPSDRTHYTVDQVYLSTVPITTLLYTANNDVIQSPFTFFYGSEAKSQAADGLIKGEWYVSSINNPYSSYVSSGSPAVSYKNDIQASVYHYVFSANMKSLFNSNGNLDGSEINTLWFNGQEALSSSDTWFKDRWYFCKYPVIEYTEGEDPVVKKYFFAPLIVISEPHEVSHDDDLPYATLATYITAPSDKCGFRFPVNMNLWYDPKLLNIDIVAINGTHNIAYNPFAITDNNGDPIIQNMVPDYDNPTTGNMLDNSLILCYAAGSAVSSNDGDAIYKHGYYEIYKEEIPGQTYPYKIGEDINLLNIEMDLSIPASCVVRTKNPAVTTEYYLLHTPIYLNNIQNVASMGTNPNTRSVGEFVASAYFNGKMFFAAGNTIKTTNELLEWDTVNTFSVGGVINQLASLNNMLFILTDEGIYTLNTDGKVEKFSSVKATMAAVAGEKLMIVGMDGKIYHTEFTPIPVSSQWQLTQNPYVIMEDDTETIKNLQETWTVYDVASLDDRFYVATNKGVWIYHGATKSWWEYKIPYEALRLVRWKDKIVVVGGDYTDVMLVGTTKFKDIPLFNGGGS